MDSRSLAVPYTRHSDSAVRKPSWIWAGDRIDLTPGISARRADEESAAERRVASTKGELRAVARPCWVTRERTRTGRSDCAPACPIGSHEDDAIGSPECNLTPVAPPRRKRPGRRPDHSTRPC